ncbi:hypothetical protein C0989_009715 [Termitomyces sp. Mn162]|nr:hypothetical protein C0989_009715 [Termitomyces sp. Mn162]
MSSPTPIQSFIGGIGLSLPVHALLLLNGDVFGISGFVHRTVLGRKEPAFAVLGLILGGAYIGLIEGHGPSPFQHSFGRVALSGLLVGLGSKLSNGCTSGHMICGLSRFSLRYGFLSMISIKLLIQNISSLVATLTFFATGVITSQLLPSELPSADIMDWSLGPNGRVLLATQVVVSALLGSLVWRFISHQNREFTDVYVQVTTSRLSANDASALQKPHPISRLLVYLATGFEFALALRFSNLSESNRVLSFLSLPFSSSFDPSLAFLAAGALPTSIILYQFFRGSERPLLGGRWSIPKGGLIDMKLIWGAAVFGAGWGLAGICPGPGLVNLGRAITGGSGVLSVAIWLSGVIIGGLFA